MGNFQRISAIVGGALQAGGQEMSDKQQIEQLRTDRNIALYNAALERRKAETARREARFNQKRQLAENTHAESALLARFGASGGALDVGAPFMAMSRQSAMFDLDRATLYYEAEQRARQHESQANLDTLDATSLDKAAKELRKAMYIRSAATFFSAVGGSMYSGGNYQRPQQRSVITGQYEKKPNSSAPGYTQPKLDRLNPSSRARL